jgi:transposase-like protein
MAEKGRMTAVELVDKLMGSEHADVVCESVAWLVAEVMEAEVSGQIGAGLGEVSAERVTQRNGYRERSWATRAGELELRIPKFAPGLVFPELSRAAPAG